MPSTCIRPVWRNVLLIPIRKCFTKFPLWKILTPCSIEIVLLAGFLGAHTRLSTSFSTVIIANERFKVIDFSDK